MGEIGNAWGEPRSIPGDMDRYIANYKADGAVGDGVAFAVVGDHENRPTDMTNLVVLGADLYNQSITGDVSKTLNSISTDADHVPVVVVISDEEKD